MPQLFPSMDAIHHEIWLRALFFRKLYRDFAERPPQPSIFGLFEQFRFRSSVNVWYKSRLVRNLAQISQCFVNKVLHCKCRAGNEHEFLVFEILSPARDCTALVVLTDILRASDSRDKSVTSHPVSLKMYSEILSRPSDDCHPALDCLEVVVKGTYQELYITKKWGKYDILRTLTYPHASARPSADQLCALLEAVKTHGGDINIDGIQCSWYANTVFLALQDIFPGGIVVPGRKEMKKGMHKGVKVSIEGGVNGLHQKYSQQIEDHYAVRGFACFLLLHIHIRSEQYWKQLKIETERARRETERLRRGQAATDERGKVLAELWEGKRRLDFNMRIQHFMDSLDAKKEAIRRE